MKNGFPPPLFHVSGTAAEAHLDPLLPVDLHTVGAERSDGSVDDLLHHLRVAVGFLQLGGGDPDVPVGGNVLSGFVQDPPSVLVRL